MLLVEEELYKILCFFDFASLLIKLVEDAGQTTRVSIVLAFSMRCASINEHPYMNSLETTSPSLRTRGVRSDR